MYKRQGHYRALDRLSKLLVVLLTLLTGVAAASLLIRGPVGDVAASWVSTDPSPWTLANLAFLIPLMGWMPGPVEMCVWPSLWMFSRARDTEHTATPKEAEFDFNLGYGITVVTAMFFVILGAYTMYGSGDGMLAGSGVSFAQKLIKLYTAAMGGWAAWVIIPAAFLPCSAPPSPAWMPIPAAFRRYRACCVITTVGIRHRGPCSAGSTFG